MYDWHINYHLITITFEKITCWDINLLLNCPFVIISHIGWAFKIGLKARDTNNNAG